MTLCYSVLFFKKKTHKNECHHGNGLKLILERGSFPIALLLA